LFGGLDGARIAWSEHDHIFGVDRIEADLDPQRTCVQRTFTDFYRLPDSEFGKVEVLLVTPPRPNRDLTGQKHTKAVSRLSSAWIDQLDRSIGKRGSTTTPQGPKVIAVLQHPTILTFKDGAYHKAMLRRLRTLGYDSTTSFMRALDFGAPIAQDWCVSLFFRADLAEKYGIPEPPLANGLPPRGMSNVLLPFGVPNWAWKSSTNFIPTETSEDNRKHPMLTGYLLQGEHTFPVFDPTGPMPTRSDALVKTKKGIRSIVPQERAQALGYPKGWAEKKTVRDAVDHSVSVNILHAIGTLLEDWFLGISRLQATKPASLADRTPLRHPEDNVTDDDDPWKIVLPDLCDGGEWYLERINNLSQAIDQAYPNENKADLMAQGKIDLAVHRTNYGTDGPTHVQLLWWEWPPEYWDKVRFGFPMNFVAYPDVPIQPNAKMAPDELAVAAEFVDELIGLGVLVALPEYEAMKASTPLFVLEKPAQPGQYRVLANMKEGGQNAYVAKDPVHLYNAFDILSRMYTGGWSAVADASKYFYSFPTRRDEQPYLGVIHPVTNEFYVWAGLPMGAGNSPAASGGAGNGFVRALLESCPEFQGTPTDNTFVALLKGESYNPKWGHARVLIGDDGLPAAIIWHHIDDFFIHAPTRDKCRAALQAFMLRILACGLWAHPSKCKLPAQVQEYVGFSWDTQNTPQIHIPEPKRSKAKALVEYLLDLNEQNFLSAKALAVVTGRLQSLVPATPGNSGNTFLRRLYDTVHPNGVEYLPSDPAYYYRAITLDTAALKDLLWWRDLLQNQILFASQARVIGTLVSAWGDGSGTGTGGTKQEHTLTGDHSLMQLWMGVWSAAVHHHSSNWKELRTLLETLRRERHNPTYQGALMIYFTDNLVSYELISKGSSGSPGLQELLREIKLLEVEMHCQVLAVHVPGVAMIRQGTDGLSRGIWMAPFRDRLSPLNETLRVFRSAPPTQDVIEWMDGVLATSFPSHPAERVILTDFDHWDLRTCMQRTTFGFPSPQLARQMVTHVIMAWVECPHDTAGIFLVPRVFQRWWRRTNKALLWALLLDTSSVYTSDVFEAEIPLVLLILPPHIPCLPSSSPDNSVDRSTLPANWREHDEQAEYLRGL
jgi:hypothetical protein